MLGPRLNAAGRIASAADGLKLLVTDDPEEAGIIANRLDVQNAKRRELDTRISDEAARMVEEEFDLSTTAGIVLAAEGWHEGVIGIVASRIVEKFHRPTVIISIDGKRGKGSARSIRNVNLYAALEKCKDLLTGFGGHQYAAGLTIESNKVDRFKDKFNEVIKETVSIDELQPKLFVDAKLAVEDIDDNLLSSLKRLSPFGIKNARPVFVSENVEVVGGPTIFGKGHLKFKVRDGDSIQSAKAFKMGDMIGALSTRPRVDIVYSVRKDKYFGKESTALYVRDIKVGKAHERPPE
jgi:single-stranded-DNA-specific exonuclease